MEAMPRDHIASLSMQVGLGLEGLPVTRDSETTSP